MALPFASIGRMFVIGRGTEFATAREIALKLLETCRVAAEPLDCDRLGTRARRRARPALPGLDDRLGRRGPARRRGRGGARAGAGATLVASGNAAAKLVDAAYVLPVPKPPLPLLSPLLSVVPGQLFASALAQAKGLDPDSPVGLSKVTLAR